MTSFLLKALTTKFAKLLAIKIAEEVAQRTDNDIDDAGVRIIKEVLDET